MADLPLLRQSERGAFKRCNWRWYQEHVVGIRPRVEKFTQAADFGTLFHFALAEYYQPGTKRGPHPAETWEAKAKGIVAELRTRGDDENIPIWEDFYTLGIDLAEAYVERYQGDPHWDVLDAERRFSVLIPDVRIPRAETAHGRRAYTPIVKLVGTMDLCFRDLNEETRYGYAIKALDHKTVARIETHHLTLDEQASTYIAVGTHALREQELIGPKEVVKGMEYNFVKRAALDTRPRDAQGQARNKPQKKHYIAALLDAERITEADVKRHEKLPMPQLDGLASGLTVLGDVSADQSSDNFKRFFVPRTPIERQRQIVRISEEARVMDMVRKGELPLLKTPQKDCYYCKFFDLCELDESGGDTEYFISTTMVKYDPYADHHEDATNSKKGSDG